MAKRKIKTVTKRPRVRKPKEIIPIKEQPFDENIITRSFFYNLDSLTISENPTHGVMLVVKNRRHEVGIEVNDEKARIKLTHYNDARMHRDISAEVTLQELIRFIHENEKKHD